MENTKNTTFCGINCSWYEIENNRVSYRTLSKLFEHILNNEIIEKTQEIGYWEKINGSDVLYYDNEKGDYVEYDDIEDWSEIDEQPVDVYQWFIISDYGYNILAEYTDEIVYYNETLDLYLWGVTHYGTMWDGVLTDIKLNEEAEA